MTNIIQKINSSKWFHNRANNIDDVHIYSTRKLKIIKKFLFGKGRMMMKYERIINLYNRKNIVALQVYKEQLSREMCNFWEGKFTKYLQLIVFSNFLINYETLNPSLKGKLFNDSIKYMKLDHEIGYLMYQKMIEIHNKN